ncbi:S-adenosyl-L-methionine-dependent methyltransferase [Trichoderma sp. SZMC 28011]|uniref:SAM-dependent methylransferase n=1 Tax=Trichoderma guizhouense TaxID=1491466 RepID=A0A1T3CXY6_9HYPO|nr:SAM-dependent methylransferase [Trichoderma guizhouense]
MDKSPGQSPPGAAGGSSQQEEHAAEGILPADHWREVSQREGNRPEDDDYDDSDGDSALGSDAGSSTASITSSILQYREIHGRRFHGETGTAQYWQSNDEAANESLDINHHALTMAMGDQLLMAPLVKENIKKALDIGTGTGIWAIDFADEYPDAQIVGTDISPIQPTWVPPNLQFEIEDCTQDWTFRSQDFDYVHMRWLLGSIQDWDALMQQAYRVLRPGGYIESLETSAIMTSDDGTVTDDCPMGQWGKFFISGGKKIGRSFTVVEDETQRKSIEAAGFVDIQEFNFKMPIGGWAKDPKLKELGQVAQMVLERDVEGYIVFMANTLGWTREEILVYISMLRRDVRSKNFHAYYNQKVVWARKPLDGEKR